LAAGTADAEPIVWSVAVADLSGSGYRFMGGRRIATANGSAALHMSDGDHRTQLVRYCETREPQRMSEMGAEPPLAPQRMTALRITGPTARRPTQARAMTRRRCGLAAFRPPTYRSPPAVVEASK
jgi:hypothetical protein